MGTKGSAPGPHAGADTIEREHRALAELIRRIHRDVDVASPAASATSEAGVAGVPGPGQWSPDRDGHPVGGEGVGSVVRTASLHRRQRASSPPSNPVPVIESPTAQMAATFAEAMRYRHRQPKASDNDPANNADLILHPRPSLVAASGLCVRR